MSDQELREAEREAQASGDRERFQALCHARGHEGFSLLSQYVHGTFHLQGEAVLCEGSLPPLNECYVQMRLARCTRCAFIIPQSMAFIGDENDHHSLSFVWRPVLRLADPVSEPEPTPEPAPQDDDPADPPWSTAPGFSY